MSKAIPPVGPDRRSVLLAGAGASAVLLTDGLWPASGRTAAAAIGRAQPFDAGWRFHLGSGDGFEHAHFDDAGWRPLDLPHDWSIADRAPDPDHPGDTIGPFDKHAAGGTATGFSTGGEGWYRKHFRLDAPPAGVVEIVFDGVYRDSDVWLNGHHLGNRASGYTPFAYDLTPHLEPTGDNVVAVCVRNLGENSRWYSGSGIYRHVWLDVTVERARIARWGVAIATSRITDAGALATINTRLADVGPGITLVSRIRDAAGGIIWEAEVTAVPNVRQVATVPAPRLWSPQSPTLYTLETELRRAGAVIDSDATGFGLRIIAFDATNGMTINALPVTLRGGCIHHDHGLLGAASFDAAEDRKVALLKTRGYNAVRTSHNPFSPAFLQACDRHGLLVVAEAFDSWRTPKLAQDYGIDFERNWLADLDAMVLSTRNHPCIVMWSIGNEIPDRNAPDGIETQWRLANEVHRLDPSRPVTAAINAFAGRLVIPDTATARPGFGGVADEASAVFLDIVGYNYKTGIYERDHRRFPKRIIYGSESFPKDVFSIWPTLQAMPFVLGDFVWTAIDYLGEAGIGGSVYQHPADLAATEPVSAWPEVISSCGDIDLIGRPKAASLARDVVWGVSDLEIAVQKPPPAWMIEVVRLWSWSDERPSWTWPGDEGRTVQVRVYTTGNRVDLRLNGHPIASRAVAAADLKRIEFQIPYAPGTLTAVAFRDGREIARRDLVTAGAPVAVRVLPERDTAGAARGDVSFVRIEIVDGEDRVVGDVVRELALLIAGPAELAAFGNANPAAHGSFQSHLSRSWDGHALAILRGTGRRGRVRIEARSPGLASGAATLSFV